MLLSGSIGSCSPVLLSLETELDSEVVERRGRALRWRS